ncbi:MAG: sel1 repeat family protein [Alphaproteobacteria bacterium]|nr:sel1 repeat family protein [Alphaproteobacteria bacterium]
MRIGRRTALASVTCITAFDNVAAVGRQAVAAYARQSFNGLGWKTRRIMAGDLRRVLTALLAVAGVLLTARAGADLGLAERALKNREFALALREFRQDAEAGMAQAQYRLGLMLLDGEGVAADGAAAAGWLGRAAEQGHDDAMRVLGIIYEEGRLGAADPARAVAWYRVAAERGNARAQRNLATHYALGQGVARDFVQAAHWYRLAAAAGNAKAKRNLAYLLLFGQGVTRDPARAAALFAEAAAGGVDKADYDLGFMYYNGAGGEHDPRKAAEHFRRAAEQGNADAQILLGRQYLYGEGVPADPARAFFWVWLGSLQKPAVAEFYFAALRNKLTPADRARLREEAANWHPRG